MRGIHHITVQNKRVRYDFDIRRNITVIRGDSATGKTTLIDMVREYVNNGAASSVDLICDKKCYVLEGVTWEGQLSVIYDSIVFIDEGNPFIYSHEFARRIQETDNYYVIVSRESLYNLPYSVNEVYGIHTSGRYGRLKQAYHEFHRIYGDDVISNPVRPEIVVVEDSNSGYQFFNAICEDSDIKCISAKGKTRIHKAAAGTGGAVTVIIADGAAFGPEMDRLTKYLKSREHIKLYLPESFEWIILSSGLIGGSELKSIMDSPSDYIDSAKFFSWEQFFTSLIISSTQDSYMRYSKTSLNKAYLSPYCRKRIQAVMDKINFEKNNL